MQDRKPPISAAVHRDPRVPRERFDARTVESTPHGIERLRRQLRCASVESTRALVAAVEAKDPYTREHSVTVAAYAQAIGKRLRLGASMLDNLCAAALLHDVGKIGVPDAILTKPGPLSDEEFDIIKRHPRTAVDILGHMSFLSDERPLILHHHERYDGGGYPAGLARDEIPPGARILAVADAMDAMCSRRSYKKPCGVERVREELTAFSGRQFDPDVTEVTLKLLDEEPELLSHSLSRRGNLRRELRITNYELPGTTGAPKPSGLQPRSRHS